MPSKSSLPPLAGSPAMNTCIWTTSPMVTPCSLSSVWIFVNTLRVCVLVSPYAADLPLTGSAGVTGEAICPARYNVSPAQMAEEKRERLPPFAGGSVRLTGRPCWAETTHARPAASAAPAIQFVCIRVTPFQLLSYNSHRLYIEYPL